MMGSSENVSTKHAVTPKADMTPNRTNVSSALVAKEAKATAVVRLMNKHGPATSLAATRRASSRAAVPEAVLVEASIAKRDKR
jgi:hypothetical protein